MFCKDTKKNGYCEDFSSVFKNIFAKNVPKAAVSQQRHNVMQMEYRVRWRKIGLGVGEIAENLVNSCVACSGNVNIYVVANHKTPGGLRRKSAEDVVENAAVGFLVADILRKEYMVEKHVDTRGAHFFELYFLETVAYNAQAVVLALEVAQKLISAVYQGCFLGALEHVIVAKFFAKGVCIFHAEMLERQRKTRHIQIFFRQGAVVVRLPQSGIYHMIGIEKCLEIGMTQLLQPVFGEHLRHSLQAVALEIPQSAVEVDEDIAVFWHKSISICSPKAHYNKKGHDRTAMTHEKKQILYSAAGASSVPSSVAVVALERVDLTKTTTLDLTSRSSKLLVGTS